MSENGTRNRELVHRDLLYDLTPNRGEFRPEDMLLGNAKWHPGGQHMLIARVSTLFTLNGAMSSDWLTSQGLSRGHITEHIPTLCGSRSGDCVLYNSAESGHSEVYRIAIDYSEPHHLLQTAS